MFADISGFTALSEKMDPEQVRRLINNCFDQLVPLVEKYGGVVDKFIGDEIMVLYGAPVAHEDDPVRALRTALEMMDALEDFNAQHGTNLGMHAGINTGLVVAGGIGSQGRQQYSVIGDTVNLAARLESASERGEIYVGPDTYAMATGLFEFEALEPIKVKGKAEPVQVYRLLAGKAHTRRLRGLVGLASPMVGRDSELAALVQVSEAVQAGSGRLAVIVGEAGLGKTRLITEWQAAASSSLHWATGQCLSYGQGLAYHLLIDVLHALLDVPAAAAEAETRAALHAMTDDLFGDSALDIYPYLGHLLSLQLAEEAQGRVKPLEPQALQAQYLAALRQFLQKLAARQPIGLILEDIHWADPSSTDLIIKLLPLTSEAPILFCLTARPERDVPGWELVSTARQQMGSSLAELDLSTLSDADSQQLMANILETEALPDRVCNLILQRAEGNPLFVEEVIRMLIDRQAVTQEDSRWVIQKEVESVEIPDSLHGLLLARIDRLPDDAKHTLRVASVIGRQFSARVLDDVLVGKQNVGPGFFDESQHRRRIMTAKQHLTYLESNGLLRPAQSHPEPEYLFRHALVQEVAYESLLLADRQKLHRQVGETLERLYADQLDELAPLLGQHFARAGEAQKAIHYLLQAGDQARALYAHREAIDSYQQVLAFLREASDHERAARTLMRLGLTYHNAFDFEQAGQAYEEGFAMWQKTEEGQSATLSLAPHPLRLAWLEPQTLDPAMSVFTFDNAIITQLFSGLVSESSEMEVVPEVAQRWEVLEAGRKYVFHLGQEMRWSDGVPLTAADFEYAWKRVLDPATESPNAHLLYDVKGAQAFHLGQISNSGHIQVFAPDEVTLVVELEEPTSYFLHLLAQSGAFPVPRHALEAHGQTWTAAEKIVTNGPFSLETWKRGELMVLSRNPAYQGRIKGNVQRVALTFLQDNTELSTRLLEMYEADHLDIVGLEPRAIVLGGARQQHAAEYMSSPILRTTYLGFDTSQPPFDNAQVRLAFAMALNLDKFVDLRANFPAKGGIVPAGMPGHSPGLRLAFQPDMAQRLLAEAGYPEGRAFPIVEGFTAEGGWKSIARNLRDQWRENLGVEVKWTIMKAPAFHSMLNEEAPALFISGWVADYPDPDTFLRANPIRRFTRWQNEVYDQLVEKARRLPDQRKRMALYRQAEKILAEDAAIVPLAYSRDEWLMKPWVKKYPISATSWWLWKDVTIEPHS